MSTTTTTTTTSTINQYNLDTFSLIWVDSSINDSDDNIYTLQRLRTIINHILTFEDSKSCEEYIRTASRADRIVLIVSGHSGRYLVPRIHIFPQVYSIYVYCMNRKSNEQWTKNYPKIESVIVKSADLVNQIQNDHNKRLKKEVVTETFAINIFNTEQGQSTTGLNGQFIHNQLLIDCLLRMKSSKTEKDDLIKLCKKQYENNEREFSVIHEFEQNYSADRAIWWYTRQSFVYRVLNKALRVQNIHLMYLFRFFIQDLHQQLLIHQCRTKIHVYRGQLMVDDELQILKNSVGKYISINSYFSTSFNRNLALHFSQEIDQYKRVLFDIEADPQFAHEKPFADISSYSYFPDESEVIFMLGSMFQLISINLIEDRVWIIQMILSNGNEHDLKPIFEHMKNQHNQDQMDLLSLGHILRNMGKFEEAENYYRQLLPSLPKDSPDLGRCYHALGIIAYEKGDYEESLKLHKNALKIKLCSVKSDDSYLANSYNSIGTIYERKKDYKRALKSFYKAFNILEQIFGKDHPKVAICLNNIAGIYRINERHHAALKNNQKALTIREKHLPMDHPDIGASHSNIGIIYRCLGQYDNAIKHHNRSLAIQEKSLPSKHPQIASTLNNVGLVYEDKGDFHQALEYFEKAAMIYRHALPSTHPNIIKTEHFIERVRSKL